MWEKDYSAWNAYGRSKLANVYFTRVLAEKSIALSLNHDTKVVSCHPGVI
jgi:NAD(P)-dependent dehydrogenase (short-subunit alcohol dehydrogenase family)